MSPVLTTAFSRTVSDERFRTYLQSSGFKRDLALRLYLWNIAVGQSFHFPLQCAEIALRNVVNAALVAVYGPDWWSNAQARATLGPDAVQIIDKAADRFKRKYAQDPKTGQIVASVTLGFWVALLKRKYERPIWDANAKIAFPCLNQPDTVSTVHSTATVVQDFRNRIFHHEPLIGRDLSRDYAEILRLIGWICAETQAWVRVNSSVSRVIRDRPR